ncbi:MAG: C4-type zinc ribbon domain-containing protein [Planctomycetota bacterium]
MSLQDQLQTYFELDQRVRAMRSRLDAALRRQAAVNHKKDQLEQQASELTTEHKTAHAHALTLESEAGGVDKKIDALRERMNQATSNKEYSALLVEVNTLKADKGKIEDKALESMSKVEQLQADLDALKLKIEEQARLVQGAAEDVKEAEAEAGDKLAELTQERDTAGEPLSADVRKQFDRLSEVYDGEAMAQIEEQNRRRMEYTCSGCYTIIPVETVNALLTRRDSVVTCANCQRILYVGPKLRESFADAK